MSLSFIMNSLHHTGSWNKTKKLQLKSYSGMIFDTINWPVLCNCTQWYCFGVSSIINKCRSREVSASFVSSTFLIQTIINFYVLSTNLRFQTVRLWFSFNHPTYSVTQSASRCVLMPFSANILIKSNSLYNLSTNFTILLLFLKFAFSFANFTKQLFFADAQDVC